jgi:hypothetical protein
MSKRERAAAERRQARFASAPFAHLDGRCDRYFEMRRLARFCAIELNTPLS